VNYFYLKIYSGIGTAGFELSALFILIILGWIFVPVILTQKNFRKNLH
jgi:hypothetical protein